MSEMQLLLQEEGVDLESKGKDGAMEQAEWEALVEELAGFKEMSHAELNRKRKRLTFAAFQDENMIGKIIAIEALVSPNVTKMGTLFSRTQAISRIPSLTDMAISEKEDLESKHYGQKQQQCSYEQGYGSSSGLIIRSRF